MTASEYRPVRPPPRGRRQSAWTRLMGWLRVRFTRRVVVCDWCCSLGVAERGRLLPDGWGAGLCPYHVQWALDRAEELATPPAE